jgi:hypothetical protein
MRHNTDSGLHGSHHTVATALWIFAGIIAVIAFGDVLALTAVALAIVTTAWWIHRELERRVETEEAEVAAVTHLRPTLIGQRDLKDTSAHTTWRGRRAA